MKIHIFVMSLFDEHCTIQQLRFDNTVADMFPQIRVIFPSQEVLIFEFDRENMMATYDSTRDKFPAQAVTRLLDTMSIDYVVR